MTSHRECCRKLRIIADNNIPFLEGRLEKVADVKYVDQFGFTPELVKDADALIIRTRTRCDEALLKGSSVKLVATATIGMDQIDVEWCRNNGITVANSPGCNAPGVAQYVWSSLLRSGFDPKRHTLGIVGCGNVGGIVAEWGKMMGCRILVNDPPREEAGMTDREYVSLEKLLHESDAVTLHTPLVKGGDHPTFHLIGKKELAEMPDGSLLVNAARGAVIDTDALIDELTTSRLSAVIDTWEGEPALNTKLLDLVDIGTFHIAGYSFEGKQRATRMVLEAVERTFGVEVDKTGLTPAYQMPHAISEKIILDSYNPIDDTLPLKEAPSQFDILRKNYNYRHEPDVR